MEDDHLRSAVSPAEDKEETVQAGDCVLIRPSQLSERHYVAKVEDIFQEGADGNIGFRVRRFYWPEEIPGGRVDYQGKAEVLLTDLSYVLLPESIESKCFVHCITKYMELECAGDKDYFCRTIYDTGLRLFYPDIIEVYCICKRPWNPDKCMFLCGSCKNWFHPSCMNVNDEGARVLAKLSLFHCKTCLPKALEDL